MQCYSELNFTLQILKALERSQKGMEDIGEDSSSEFHWILMGNKKSQLWTGVKHCQVQSDLLSEPSWEKHTKKTWRKVTTVTNTSKLHVFGFFVKQPNCNNHSRLRVLLKGWYKLKLFTFQSGFRIPLDERQAWLIKTTWWRFFSLLRVTWTQVPKMYIIHDVCN